MPIRILIVDDDEDHMSTLARLLRLEGHRVECAPNAPNALAMADVFYPELVLLDIGLPGMGGYEAVGKFKKRFPETQVFAVTGRSGKDSRQRSLRAGFDEHFSKPVSVSSIGKAFAAKAQR